MQSQFSPTKKHKKMKYEDEIKNRMQKFIFHKIFVLEQAKTILGHFLHNSILYL